MDDSKHLTDYLIDPSEVDWATALSPWHEVLPEEMDLWMANRFGDLFLVYPDDSIVMFDIGTGELQQVAASQDEFADALDVEENANNWLMIPLVDRLVEAGKTLSAGRCYSYIQPPVLGGEYSVENTMVVPIVEHYSLYAKIYEQTKDLPDGTTVEFKIDD